MIKFRKVLYVMLHDKVLDQSFTTKSRREPKSKTSSPATTRSHSLITPTPTLPLHSLLVFQHELFRRRQELLASEMDLVVRFSCSPRLGCFGSFGGRFEDVGGSGTFERVDGDLGGWRWDGWGGCCCFRS